MINAVKAIRLAGKTPTLETRCYARMKTTEKLAMMLLLHFFGCNNPSHLPHSATADRFSARYNMLYRLLRDATVDWRKVISLINRRVAAYIGTHCQDAEGRIRCLVTDDTDIAESEMRMEIISRAFSHTQHRHILGFKGLLLGINDGVESPPVGLLAARRKGEGRHVGPHGQTEESP